MTDDEFVARAGEMAVWVDRVWSAAAPAAIAITAVLLLLGATPAAALLVGVGFVGSLSWVLLEREWDRYFPDEEAS